MYFKYFFFCILLFYNVEAKMREVVCPGYCSCDVFKSFKRAVCQSKKLVSAEIGIPPEVEIFDLSYNQISELGNRVFAEDGLTELKLLNLSNNKISQIHMFAFEGIKNLKSLDLSFNILEYFLEQWFPSWQNLQELYLQGNNLVLINKQPILNLPSLKILDLSQSKIEHFNPNVFTLLPKLEILDISSNYIESLNGEVIIPLINLQLLVAKKNNLDCKEKLIPSLRQLIRKKSITYVGPCIRRDRRTRTRLLNAEIRLPSPNRRGSSDSVVQDKIKFEKNLETWSVAPAGYSGVTEKIGKSEKNVLNEDLNKTTDVLAKHGTNENDKIIEKIDKIPKYGEVKDKTIISNEDGKVVEKINKIQNSGVVEGVNKPDDTEKIKIFSNLETVNDSEILGDLKKYINSDKFQKMKMESPSPINNNNFIPFNNDDKIEISNNNKTEKLKDDDFIDDIKDFLHFEKFKLNDSKAKLIRETPTIAPETLDKKSTVPELAAKNAWMVDDDKSEINLDKIKNYLKHCNSTKNVYFNNVLDKMAKEIIEISPSMILLLFTLFGFMLGLVLGCSVQIKENPNIKNAGCIFFDLFKRRKPKNKEDKNEPDDNEIKIPIPEDEIIKIEDNKSNESSMECGDDESDDCDICVEEREMLKERKNKNRPRSPFEDRTFLLDNELVQDGTTPMLGKKEFSSTED